MTEKRSCRVAVSSFGESIDSDIAPLTRSPYFIIFEGAPEKHRAVKNNQVGSGSEIGQKVAKELLKNGVDIVITGTLGKRSFETFKRSGIKVHGGCSGRVSDSIQKCMKGELEDCKGATYSGDIEF